VRVGILGGTFDPVHVGHLVLAESARSELALELVLLIPAREPWRKGDRDIAPADERLAMLTLAVEGNDGFGISDVELRRGGPTYTADTIEQLAAERLDDEFYFILGEDALADLPHWHEPERIVRHARLAVAPRAVEAAADPDVLGVAGRVERFSMPLIDISSTDIRRRVREGRSIRYLVPDAVGRYIAERGLYAGG
jgi:nicotinate-nucleotide adenylyltransferase